MGNANDCGSQMVRCIQCHVVKMTLDAPMISCTIYHNNLACGQRNAYDGRAEILFKQGGGVIPKWAVEFNRTSYMNSVRRPRHAETVHGSFTFRTDSGSSAQLPATRTLCCIIDRLRQSSVRLLEEWHVWDDPLAVQKVVTFFYYHTN